MYTNTHQLHLWKHLFEQWHVALIKQALDILELGVLYACVESQKLIRKCGNDLQPRNHSIYAFCGFLYIMT